MNNFEKQLNNLPKARLSRRADLMIRYKLLRAALEQGLSGLRINFFTPASLRPVFAALVIVVLAFSGVTSAYAYNSNEITRLSILYPVKIGLEKIESKFATTPAAEVRFHNKLAGRRIAEAQILSLGASSSSTDEAAGSTAEAEPIKLVHENEFNDTLDDADDEINQANENAAEIADQTELEQSLALLSDSHLDKLEKIKTVAAGVGLETDDLTTDNIAKILDNIKNRQQTIVRAISQFNGDLRKAGENDETDGTSSEPLIIDGASASTTSADATSSLNQAESEIKSMETELAQSGRISEKQLKQLTERLNKKINQAESAIQSGDLKKFNGLLRATKALTNNGQHFLRENKQPTKPNENKPIENSGEKIKAQYNLKELQQKQEEQRKRLEELRQQEIKTNVENPPVVNDVKTSDQNVPSSLGLPSDQSERNNIPETLDN